MKSIRERIVAYRTKEKLDQKDLAARLGWSTSHLSDVERGTRRISEALAEDLSKEIGMPKDRILLLQHREQGARFKDVF